MSSSSSSYSIKSSNSSSSSSSYLAEEEETSSSAPVAQTGEGTGFGGEDAAASPVVYSPMFNSGAFRVPWEQTEALIRDEFRGWPGRWVVLAPPGSA